MKYGLALIITIFMFSAISTAQTVGIGIGTVAPDSSAVLDISASGQGVLIPRMDSSARLAIPSPAVGLMVFDSTSNAFWYFGNNGWLELGVAGQTASGTYFYFDDDLDGFGDPTRPVWVPSSGFPPNGFVADCSDFNDADSSQYFGAPCGSGPNGPLFFDSTGTCILEATCEPDSCGPANVLYQDSCEYGTCWMSGTATVYGTGQGGNCGWQNDDLLIAPFNGNIAAVGADRWDGGLACGDVYDVVCTGGSNTDNCDPPDCSGNVVRVMVVDRCPECPSTQLDLSTSAWAELINSSPCIADITFRRVGHEYGVNINLEVKPAANAFFMEIYPKFSNKKIITIEVSPDGDPNYYDVPHTENQGFWTISSSGIPLPLVFPLSFRFTADDGSVISASDVITSTDAGDTDSGVNFSFIP